MPINKFNGYYYGVGLKLDEKSVNDFSKQLENKLNKTVANVTKEITSLQEALKLGKDADLTPLVASLNAAVNGIRGVNDADFNVLKAQVEDMDNKFKGLTQTVEKLGVDLTDVSKKFDSVVGNLSTKIDRFLSQPSTMRDSLKHDLRAMQDMAKYYSEALKLDPNTKATGLEAYFAEFKNQFGNISELSDIATQEIAQDFLRLGDLLRNSGLPIEGIRSELLQMTTQLESAFKLKNPAGAEKLFQSIGYQVDASEAKLAGLQKQMQELERESERLSTLLDKSGNVKFNGGTLAKEDQILNLEEKIEKVKHYLKQIQELDEGSIEWVNTFKNSISLVRSVEKEIAKIKAPDDRLVVEWGKFLQGFNLDVGETLGASLISDFSTQIGYAIEDIADQRQNLDTESKKLTQSIAELAGTQKKLNDVKTKKPGAHQVKGQIQEQYKLNLSEEVNLKVKIDNEAWRKAINASITKIEQKIVPIKIKAELKDAEKVKGEITKLKNAQLMTDGTKKKGKDAGADKDAETFNKRFDNLLKTINGKKKELNEALTSWHKEFDKMFEFQFKVNGLKKDEYGNLSTVIANLVDSINTTLEDKPLKFTSNIEELAAKIQEQLQNIKIDNLQVGGISAGSIGAGGITSTGGIPMFPMQIIPAINGAGQAAQGAAQGFQQAGQAAEEAGQKAQSKTETIVRTGEKQVEALLEAYGKLTDAQRSRISKKSPDFAKAMSDLEKNPTWDNYQKNILRFGDLTKIINDVRPNNGIQQFIDKIQEDIIAYDKLDDESKKSSSRANSYVENIVKEYFNQISKKGKPNVALASNKDLFNIFAQLKDNPTYENYKKLVLNNTELGDGKESIFSALEGVRPTSKVQNFIKLLVEDQKAYIAAFGKPVVESAAAQQNRQWFENGKQIVEYIIQLAQMAAKIQPLRSKTGVEITKDLFGDGDLSRWISGRQVSVEDIGTIIGKKDVANSDVDKFLSDMGMTKQNLVGKTDPYTAQYLNPLLTAIKNFKEKQLTLDKALAQLQSDQPTKNMQKFIDGFGAAENKESYLADNLKWLQTISKKGATTDAQKYIADTFKNNNIDISTLKSAKTQAEQWQIIQDQIFNNPQVDFNKLMGDLRAGKDNFNSSYKDFVEIIGIAKRFVASSNALSDIGKVANSIVEGTEETITRQNGTKKKIKVNGLRSELNKYGVIITGQDGASFGYRAGQETVENGIFGNRSAFTQIANQLAAALQNAVDIAFTKNKIDGLDVKQYRATTSEPKATYTDDKYFNRDLALQRRDYYQQEINKLNARLQRQESNYNALSSQEGFNQQLGKNLKKNSRYVELEDKMYANTATVEEKIEFTKIVAEASNALKEQTTRLATSIQKTKDDLKALTDKLDQSKEDYAKFNSQIKKQEEEFKKGTYHPTETSSQNKHTSELKEQTIPKSDKGVYLDSAATGVLIGGNTAGLATEAKQDAMISALKERIKTTGDKQDGKKTTEQQEKKPEKNLSTVDQAKQAQQAIGSMSKEASVKIDSTGKQTIHTIQKIGAETAKVTQVTEDGVTKSTLELSNKYETAMKSLFQKIRGDSGKYLFGAETVRFGVETTEAQDTLLKYVDTYRQLEDAMEQYKKSGDILLTDGPNQGKQLQTVINDLQTQLGEYEQRLVSISNASQSFLGGKTPFAMLDGAQLKDSANSLKLLATSTEECAVAFNGVYNNGTKLMYDVLQDGTMKRYALEVDAATGNVRKFELSEAALVNAFQNVNKVARQGEELKGILNNDSVNQDATIIQNYKNNLQDMHAYIDKVWDAARQNGGLIPIDEQDKIYAMSQEVLRLGATIQKEYKRIATIRDSGTPFELFGQIGGAEEVETKMRQYLNRFAEGQTLQVSNLQYDSVTQSMTADLVDLYGTITKVKLEYNELLNSVNVSSAKGTNSIDDMSTKMVKIGDNIDQALGAGVINKNLDEYKAYAAEVAKLDELIANIENGTIAYNVDAIQQWNAQRQAVIDTGKALSEVAQINAKKSLPGVRAVEAQGNKKIKIDNMIETIPGAQDSSQYQSYIAAYEKLLTLREKFRTEGTLGLESNQKQLQVESDKVNQLANSLSKLLQESAKIRASASDEDILKLPNSFDVQNLEAEMKKFAGVSSDATKEQWKFNNATSSASYVIKGADNVVSEMTVSYDALTNSIVRTTNQQYKVKTALQEFADSVGNKFKELGRYLLSFGSFYQIWGVIRQGVTYVRDIDSALTELKKVTDETDASYDRFLQDMSKTGSVIGATVSNLTTMAAEWARLGYTMEEAGRLAESTAILLNVSEFEDATTASEALISTMQAFQYTADESQHVVDILNEVKVTCLLIQ